ncbi:MAG: DUF1257 domain-containing protein [Spirochaetales bacterium]|nr:DUF1257 domain-containing protein [Spirochaetales bacterium]
MSHFTKVKTKIKNIEMLKLALKTLGMSYEEAIENKKVIVKGWEKNNLEADLSINPGCSYGIAVNKVNDEYELNADWWAIETYTGKTQEDLINKIEKQYAYETIMDKIKQQGYSVVTEEESKDQIKLVVRRWA